MSKPDRLSVAVGKMDMSYCRTCLADRISQIGFFDIHVKQVGKQLGAEQSSDHRRALCQCIALVGFVAIQWFVKDFAAYLFGSHVEMLEPMTQILFGKRLWHPRARSALHRTEDHRGTQIGGYFEHRLEEYQGLRPD